MIKCDFGIISIGESRIFVYLIPKGLLYFSFDYLQIAGIFSLKTFRISGIGSDCSATRCCLPIEIHRLGKIMLLLQKKLLMDLELLSSTSHRVA